MKIALLFVISILTSTLVQAAGSYNQCAAGTSRNDLDNLCPRLEGAHLPECCPQLFKADKLSCEYYIVKQRGQPYLAKGSFSTCEDTDGDGVGDKTQQNECCEVKQKACYTDPVNLQFQPRLINRNKACCFENCPPPRYWVNGRRGGIPQATEMFKMTNEHELRGGHSQCVSETLPLECSQEVTCQTSNPCPAANPGEGTGTGTGSGNGGGGGGATPSEPTPPGGGSPPTPPVSPTGGT